MGQKKYPRLISRDVREILKENGFQCKGQVGSHEQWERPAIGSRKRAVVTVDDNESPFDEWILKSMIRQSGLTREEFYGSTKSTARMAGVRYLKDLQLNADEKSLK